MQVYKILGICNSCGGDGIRSHLIGTDSEGEETCPRCGGVGRYEIGCVEYAKDNLFPSYQILECLDVTEYNGLTEAQKHGIFLLLACGTVDLSQGKKSRACLLNWFGAESNTIANLTSLFT
jgi:hypothetical protein